MLIIKKSQHLKRAGKEIYSTIRLCIDALVDAVKESKKGVDSLFKSDLSFSGSLHSVDNFIY